MSLSILHTRAQSGISALPVNVEVHLAGGLPSTTIVGLADTEVKESRERVRAALHLLSVFAHLSGQQPLLPVAAHTLETVPARYPDLADVRGQAHAKRALIIAAAGGHSLLLIGPPGTGKTMLASRLPGILPPMTETEALESAAIQSISHHGFDPSNWQQRPYRAPHHTTSGVALVGGGSNPRPGEISLAHHGILFLSELPEFDRRVLEVLREPMESGAITISRAARQAMFPAQFQLVAAMNPCTCGYAGHPSGRSRCTPDQIQRYRSRISGPIMDRIDMHVDVPSLPLDELQQTTQAGPSSKLIQQQVSASRDYQLRRQHKTNALLNNQELEQVCQLSNEAQTLLNRAIDQLGLSTRAYHRILRLARTLADLESCDQPGVQHVAEAIGYRRLDRSLPAYSN